MWGHCPGLFILLWEKKLCLWRKGLIFLDFDVWYSTYFVMKNLSHLKWRISGPSQSVKYIWKREDPLSRTGTLGRTGKHQVGLARAKRFEIGAKYWCGGHYPQLGRLIMRKSVMLLEKCSDLLGMLLGVI